MKPVPQALLIRGEKVAEVEQTQFQFAETLELSCRQRPVLLAKPETKPRLARARLTRPAAAAQLERGIGPHRSHARTAWHEKQPRLALCSWTYATSGRRKKALISAAASTPSRTDASTIMCFAS